MLSKLQQCKLESPMKIVFYAVKMFCISGQDNRSNRHQRKEFEFLWFNYLSLVISKFFCYICDEKHSLFFLSLVGRKSNYVRFLMVFSSVIEASLLLHVNEIHAVGILF